MNVEYLNLIRNVAIFRKEYHTFVSKSIKDLNISSTEFSYLRELILCDGVIQEVIVQNSCMDKAAASRVTKSLESQGLIRRVRNENDKRSFNVYLTPKGKELTPFIHNILNEWYSKIQASIGVDNLDLFNTLFKSINEKSFN